MKTPFRIRLINFYTRWRYWEHWPFGLLQAPLFLQWLWFSFRSKSLFYFTASNPSIYTGGMMGESKSAVLDLIPVDLKPKTILLKLPASPEMVLDAMNKAGISFPCIFKPDLGERGWMVNVIRGQGDLKDYLKKVPIDFIVQEYVHEPMEFGVYYVRKPEESQGKVVSVTGKMMLSVTGDGKKSIGQLIERNRRARLQYKKLRRVFEDQWETVLEKGETFELNPIGNHCLGTTFLNCGNLIDEQLEKSFNDLSDRIPGFYFGRFDLRCASEADLRLGRVKIMELNGCGAEPSHIYQPGFSIWSAWKTLFRHMNDLYEVSVQNSKRGTSYMSFGEGIKVYKRTTAILGKDL